MSTVLEHSANASATIEYKGKYKYGKIPAWVREKQLENYYNSMAEFYSECVNELELPKQFAQKELITRLMLNLRTFMHNDEGFTNTLIRLMDTYPKYPTDNKTASEYIIALKNLSERVAHAGLKSNQELAMEALISTAPFSAYSNLCLGNFTISYFHEYKAKTTEEYFKRNHLLVSGRSHLKSRKLALHKYFQTIEPKENLFKKLLNPIQTLAIHHPAAFCQNRRLSSEPPNPTNIRNQPRTPGRTYKRVRDRFGRTAHTTL
jgi:hypothetical protein